MKLDKIKLFFKRESFLLSSLQIISVSLVFLFIFISSISYISAQVTDSPPATSSSDATVSPSMDSQTTPTVPVDTTDSSLAKGGTISPLISTPSSPSFPDLVKPITAKVDKDSFGGLTFEYPVTIPPGRGKLTPDVRLFYSSNNLENANILGYGWSASIPYIERINRTGSQKLYTTDYYTSFFDGELASTTSNYWAKYENGNFIKYATSSNTFTATDKFGTVYKFGTATTSRQDSPNDSNKIYRWLLDEVRDTNDNYIKYTYYKDAGQVYPSSIVYTGNGTTDGIFEVDFLRESRSDTASTSKAAFPLKSNYRINKIEVKANGIAVRKYDISYTAGQNGTRSLLQTITETGVDEASTTPVSLPVTTFGYTQASTTWTKTAGYDHDPSENANGVTLIDVNGDGYTDRVLANGTTKEVYINDGTGHLVLDSGWTVPGPINWSTDTGYRFVDVNGDGLPDIVHGSSDYCSSPNVISKDVYINTGSNWVLNISWVLPVDFVWKSGGCGSFINSGTAILDLNGDGLSDFSYGVSGSTSTASYVNAGSGWIQSSSGWAGGGDGANGVTYMDANGDGFPDEIYAHNSGGSSGFYVYLNDGNGNFGSASSYIPPSTINDGANDQAYRLADVNSDGLVDIIFSYQSTGTASSTAYINNGSNWVHDSSWDGLIPMPFVYSDGGGFVSSANTTMADVSGDGLVDIVSGFSTFNNQGVYIKNGPPADLLNKVTYSTGGSANIAYKASPQYKSASTRLLSRKLPLIINTVERITQDDGLGAKSTKAYTYAGGVYFYMNPLLRKFAGFATTTETDDQGNYLETYFHTGTSSDSSHGLYNDDVSKIGKVYRTENYDSNSNLYAKSITKWDMYDLGNGRTFVKPTQTVSSQYDGNTTHKDIAEANTYENTYGNLTQKILYGEVTGSDDGTFSDTGSDIASTTISYAASSSPYIVGIPSQETTQDQSGNKVKEVKHYYDSQSLGGILKGNETKTENWITGSTYASTTKTYDGTYGLVTQSKDPNSKTTSYTYDSYNLYVATSTNPLSQATGYLYDLSSGKVRQMNDPNNRVFQTIFDGLDRPTSEIQPDSDTPSSQVTKVSYAYTDSNTPGSTSIHKTSNLNSATSSELYIYFDGLGRKIQERKEAKPSNTYAVKDSSYNNLGLLASESLPYFASSTSRGTATTTTTLFTQYTYDPLNRISKINNALGTTTNTYDDRRLTITDANSKSKDFYSDAYGNLINVVEYVSSTPATTTYTWDLNKNLTSITDTLSNVRNFTYDGLNRRLTAQDLHASGDSYFGSWSYIYDPAGNITSYVDPKSQTINQTYDSVNRPLTEDYTGGAGTEITYTYDSCADGIGHLCTSVTSGATTTYLYNALGLVRQERKTINSVDYTASTTYDRLGNINTTLYPDNSQVKYIYNDAGLIEKVARKESTDSNFTTVISQTDYSPLEQVSYRLFANGASTTNTYDATQLYRLTRKITSGVATTTGGVNMLMVLGGGTTSPESMSLVDGSTMLLQPKELVNKRTPRTESFALGWDALGKAIVKTKLYERDHYYRDASDSLIPIDSSLLASTTVWQTSKTPYSATIKKTFGNDFLVFTNSGQTLGLSLLAYPKQKIMGQVGTTTGPDANKEIIYSNALGQGIDLKIYTDVDKVVKNVSISTLSALGSLKGKTNYELSFVAKFNHPVTIQIGTTTLQVGQPIVASSTVAIVDTTTGTRSYIRSPYVVDSSPHYLPNYLKTIDIRYTLQTDGSLLFTKLLPVSWLSTATFPIKTDGTLSQYVGSGDGSVGNDDTSGSSWSSVRSDDGTGGRVYSHDNYTDTNIRADQAGSGPSYVIGRTTMPFDTSALPDDAVITAATLNVYGTNKGGNSNLGLYLVESSTTATSSISHSDYPKFGSTAWSSLIGNSSLTTSAYNALAMNSTGYGAISKTGWTKIGMREESDFNNVAPTGETSCCTYFEMSTSEVSGTSQDPYLEVTYTTATTSNPVTIQDFTYTYDPVGNITKIVDNSTSNSRVTTDYTYDDLYRLTQVIGTSTATSTNFTKTYTYNSIGNISSSTDMGYYLYTGTTSTLYANPHAPTNINGSTYSYDNNGNLTSGGGLTNTWDYGNRLLTTNHNSLTETYAYDANNNRVSYATATTTTYYANPLYSVLGATSTKYITINDEPIARIVGSNASSTIFYIHPDHLGGIHVLSDASGLEAEAISYYPYGALRVDDKLSANDQRKYINQYLDATTNLSYLNARYYQSTQGQFLSEDPSYLAVGDPSQLKQLTGQDLQTYLSDPQQLNSYGYARDNPITKKDPGGNVSTWALFNPLTYTQLGLGYLLGDAFALFKPNASRATTELFNRSLSLNPSPISITENNQYSYIIDLIKNSDEYNKFVSNVITEANKSGVTHIDKIYKGASISSGDSIGFKNGDLLTAIGGTLSTQIKGTKSLDGNWNFNLNIKDNYNFQLKNYKNIILNTTNNLALIPQLSGVISNYDIDINFKDSKKK